MEATEAVEASPVMSDHTIPATASCPSAQETKEPVICLNLEENEKTRLLELDEFKSFFDQTFKIFERSEHVPYDVTIDYSKASSAAYKRI